MTERQGLSRRKFLQGVGAGALVAGALPKLGEAKARQRQGPTVGPDAVSFTLNINGEDRRLELEPRVTLLDALRNHLDLTGAKKVCDRATCGSCTTLMDGKPVYSCTVLAISAQGRRITTVEGLGRPGALAPIQQAFIDNDAQQCGFCTPGLVMASAAMLDRQESPTVEQVHDGLGGDLCR